MDPADPDRIPRLPLTSADAARLPAQAGNALLQFPWVRTAWLHGSLVRGERPPRDLDQGYRKNRWTAHTVIPAKAGTQANGLVFSLGPRLRGGDEGGKFDRTVVVKPLIRASCDCPGTSTLPY